MIQGGERRLGIRGLHEVRCQRCNRDGLRQRRQETVFGLIFFSTRVWDKPRANAIHGRVRVVRVPGERKNDGDASLGEGQALGE